jgi:hypothetical protein
MASKANSLGYISKPTTASALTVDTLIVDGKTISGSLGVIPGIQSIGGSGDPTTILSGTETPTSPDVNIVTGWQIGNIVHLRYRFQTSARTFHGGGLGGYYVVSLPSLCKVDTKLVPVPTNQDIPSAFANQSSLIGMGTISDGTTFGVAKCFLCSESSFVVAVNGVSWGNPVLTLNGDIGFSFVLEIPVVMK